ncbi:tetratricopeptide repeat protein [Edaphobacter sp. 12200R-103]|uniref:tetratricopeptide repeat protein n=1 Tax=Edaphobacter sp. 12200R-103 TaxID=2703788 RepID=UPI001EE3E665|nr:tetratricopeptide repeat protein [Edaphobacter sp. 12200R-103]
MLRFASFRPTLCGLLLVLALSLAFTPPLPAQQQADQPASIGRVVLVLPFENHSGQSDLAWIGDSFPDTLNQRLSSASFLTISRDDRQYALDHLGFPTDFRPTRATTIRIAQTLDANYVVIGSYTVNNGRISAQAQVLSVNELKMSAPIQESNDLRRLFDVQNTIAWKIAKYIDPQFNVAQQTFLAASGQVRLSAFENYIRGTGTGSAGERIKRLQLAVQQSPGYAAALLALGKTQYSERDYDQAAVTLDRIPKDDRLALEANFYLGLSRFNSARYAEAEKAFSFVASRLPLPEVINNQAVALSRQGHNATALFQRAVAADPKDADYHYNLAVSLFRSGNRSEARREVDLALKLRPADPEAPLLKSLIAQGAPPPAPASANTANRTGNTANSSFEPLERIRRSYSEASFRQAAFQIDQMRAARLATLPASEQAAQYVQMGSDYLAQGLIPEAEREFQSALTADPASAQARAGLAQIRERSGDTAAARDEAHASIKLKPNAAAYLVLARLELNGNQIAASAADVAQALKVEPNNTAALGMKQALAARGQSLP